VLYLNPREGSDPGGVCQPPRVKRAKSKGIFMESVNGRPAEPCGLGFEQLSLLADADLIAHFSAGHHDALAVLFDRYHRLILSIAFKVLRDPAEAEDVMQSVFLEIYRVAGQFDAARGSAKVWLLQYAYHRSMNRREYLKLRGFYARDRQEGRSSRSPAVSDRESAPMAPAFPEVGCMVREVLGSLSPSQQNVLHMSYFEDLPLKDIAARTGESLGNVRHHYYRALRRLRSLWAHGEGEKGNNRTRQAQFEIAARGSIDVET
jgi:RNA polymerase sigma-70 factor, ECF subfamily